MATSSSTRPRVFITQPIADSAIEKLSAKADVDWNRDSSRILPKADLIRAINDTEYLFCFLHDTVDADVIAAAPRLEMIASMGGVSMSGAAAIDVDAATKRKIVVTVGPGVVHEATADMTWALIMAVSRRLLEGDRLARSGVFPGSQSNHLLGRYVFRKTLGIVGAGRVGQAVARRASGFGMTILYSDPRRLPLEDEQRLGARHVSLDELLAEADIVTIHAIYTKETFHLIGAPEIARMKPTTSLINISRGPVLDEAALVAALKEGRLAGAALDVHEDEPRVNPELVKMDNVVLTPHLGSAVAELREEMALFVADNILAAIDGRRPQNVANPAVYA